ncbi:MAG TPA: hypothetical protein VKE74_23630 [Gemmataceae bacterium]|nr:hypothetical protein [Gemmataceae bacterium]
MLKYHIWFWPFNTTDSEYEEIVRDTEHLYKGKDKIFRVVDASVCRHSGWRQRIASETSRADTVTVVTIYVMGHTNINFQSLHSHLDTSKGESLDALKLALRLNWIVELIHPNAAIKVKFLNCRSAHARYPRPTCERLAQLSGRAFTGFAYGLDISTKTRIEGTNQYKPNKEVFFKTSETDVVSNRAKEGRFQVWPELRTVTDTKEPTTLEEFLELLG